MTTVAAVLPAFNAAAFIADALDSVRAQTRVPDEIIVADDASTDDTAGAVAAWSKAAGVPVSVVRLEVNGGAGAARNAGFRAARSDLIAMLDADDTWRPTMVERLAGALEASPGAVVAFGLREFCDERGPLGRYQADERLTHSLGRVEAGGLRRLESEAAFLLNLESCVSGVSSAVVRRDAAIACGLFDPAFRTSQDREFMLRLSREGEFVFIREPVALYRLHEANTTHGRNAVRNAMNGLRVLDKIYGQRRALALTEAEVAATRGALERAAHGVLYTASARGLRAFAGARREVARSAARASTWSPDIVLRACWRSLVPDPDIERIAATRGS